MTQNSAVNTGIPPQRETSIAICTRLKSILVVDDEADISSVLKRGLEKQFRLVEVVKNTAEADEIRQRYYFDLIISDIRLPGKSGVDWIAELRQQGNTSDVIFMTAHADLDTAIAALRTGAADFIMKPFRMEQMLAAVQRCMERQKIQRENFVLKRQVEHQYDGSGLLGDCELFQNIRGLIRRVAPTPSTVMIEGESGTGKELAARAIHNLSARNGSFVPVNCGAMTHELLESELFGHMKGAFTGAQRAREGLFAYAEGGTLFLDEIGEMPLAMQGHLLRVLEERHIRPVGSNQEIPVDVRIIAATNRNLGLEVKQGNFREDLFFRLNVLSIRMPPLREHKEDLPVLVRHFTALLATELGVPVPEPCHVETVQMMAYDWPGNVRELKNVIERCLLLNAPPTQCMVGPALSASTASSEPESEKPLLLEAVEKQHILRVLDSQDGNKSAAARLLGISRKTLERKVMAWNPV